MKFLCWENGVLHVSGKRKGKGKIEYMLQSYNLIDNAFYKNSFIFLKSFLIDNVFTT